MSRITQAIHQRLAPRYEKIANLLVPPERILRNPYVAAKHVAPLRTGPGYYIIPRSPVPARGEPPVPPVDMRERYGTTDEVYLASGREHMGNMVSILRAAGAHPETFGKVLDFGCAAGRMLRFFPQGPMTTELWGVDMKAKTIDWCQRHFGPPFHFGANTSYPHLPFEDNYFDLVYAGSVFTHIADLADAWFLELRRLTRKGGYLYLTIHDKQTVDLLFSNHKSAEGLEWFIEMLRRFDQQIHVLAQDYACFSVEGEYSYAVPVPQVFYDVEYLRQKWSPLAPLLSVTPEAYGRHQTALLFQK